MLYFGLFLSVLFMRKYSGIPVHASGCSLDPDNILACHLHIRSWHSYALNFFNSCHCMLWWQIIVLFPPSPDTKNNRRTCKETWPWKMMKMLSCHESPEYVILYNLFFIKFICICYEELDLNLKGLFYVWSLKDMNFVHVCHTHTSMSLYRIMFECVNVFSVLKSRYFHSFLHMLTCAHEQSWLFCGLLTG